MKPPRLGYLTGEYPRSTDTFIQREVAALRDKGMQVETLSIRRPASMERGGPELEPQRSSTFYVLPCHPLALLAVHAAAFFGSPKRYLRACELALKTRPPGLKALARQLAYLAEAALVAQRMRRRGLTHLHNHFSNSSCSVAMLAAEMGGFPFSFTIHGPSEFFQPHHFRLDEKIRRAAFVCCISQFCRSQAMLFCSEKYWSKLHVVHCGVLPEEYETARHSGIGQRLLFVGRLAAAKGLPVLLAALAEVRQHHPDVQLTIAGDGPDRRSLQVLSWEYGVDRNVCFLGYQSPAEVKNLLRQADVFVLASFAEGVPVVLMEAMAAGVPVIATQIAGVPELVEDGLSGLLVPPGDPAPLAAKISALLDDAELRGRLAEAGRLRVEREFNIEMEAGKLQSIFAGSAEARYAVQQRPFRLGAAPELTDAISSSQLNRQSKTAA